MAALYWLLNWRVLFADTALRNYTLYMCVYIHIKFKLYIKYTYSIYIFKVFNFFPWLKFFSFLSCDRLHPSSELLLYVANMLENHCSDSENEMNMLFIKLYKNGLTGNQIYSPWTSFLNSRNTVMMQNRRFGT